MPSQNMLPKGKRRQSVKKEYREQRTLIQEREAELRAAGEEVEGHVMEMVETAEFTPKPSPFAHVPGLVTSGPSGGKHPQEAADLTPRRYAAPKLLVETPEVQVLEDLEPEDGVRSFTAEAAAAGLRLDAYLAKAIPEISRARVVLLIDGGQVMVDGKPGKGKQKLKGGEAIEIEGEPKPEPLHATAEDIPLTVVYEDEDLAVVDKAAGMMVHAGAGSVEQNSGTLVNALLWRFGGGAAGTGGGLSEVGGGLRPGIVHRLDKQTSGLIVVAKNDVAHRKLGELFSEREMRKSYVALVHGWVKEDEGMVQLPIARDLVRRIRMTTRRADGRSAVSHWKVLERVSGRYGKFTLVQVRIETGRTHQIRVHMSAIGYPVVGDFLYGAPHRIKPVAVAAEDESLELERNFLHAAELAFEHPRTGETLELRADLPPELVEFLEKLRAV